MKRKIIAKALNRTGFSALWSKVVKWSGVICFNYHRIADGDLGIFDHDLWSVAAAEFEAHVQILKKHYDVIGTDDLEDALRIRKGRLALITFDDGYIDNYEVAFPILKRHQVPATFFITTGFVDGQRLGWWDEIAWMVRSSRKSHLDLSPWAAEPVPLLDDNRQAAIRKILVLYKTLPGSTTASFLEALAERTGSGRFEPGTAPLPWMTWDMVREMRRSGMSIGGHTVNHPVLARLPREEQREEIAGCARRLHEELGEPMIAFSYPVGKPGAFNEDTRSCLKEAGVPFAFSYYGGFNRFHSWDNHDICRVEMEAFILRDLFRAMVTLPQVFSRY